MLEGSCLPCLHNSEQAELNTAIEPSTKIKKMLGFVDSYRIGSSFEVRTLGSDEEHTFQDAPKLIAMVMACQINFPAAVPDAPCSDKLLRALTYTTTRPS